MGTATPGNLAKRTDEWFVPRFGPEKFRVFLGLLFLPYTGMVLSYTVIGSMLAHQLQWDRVLAICVIYFLGLGIAAHALDALGSKRVKPWGNVFGKRALWMTAVASLCGAYAIGIYYIVFHVPLLAPVAVLEGFFVFAYNLEWFGGRFHTDKWFAFSWGFLPLTAGYIIQTNSISPEVVLVGAAMFLFSYVEINASRPYKELKRRRGEMHENDKNVMLRYEAILKSISIGVIVLAIGLAVWRGLLPIIAG
ncbi:MAG: hypothetical protein P8181_04805 [bacterium]